MNPPIAEKLQNAVTQARWNEAVALLQTCDAIQAAAALGNLPFEQQQSLFRRLPLDLAAVVIAQFPYYHEYVLLHSLPAGKMRVLVDKLNPDDRMRFFDELPEEAWQRLMDELSSAGAAETSGPHEPETVRAPEEQPSHLGEPIIEAFQIEQGFEQPDGRQIKVIAPMDLSVESDTIFALLGPSGSGKSTLLRILSGLTAPSRGTVLVHGQPLDRCAPNIGIVFQSFALFPWLTVLENVELPLVARGLAHTARHHQALQVLAMVGLKGCELMELWTNDQIPTKSIFLVTHNIEEAVLLADRIVVLGTHPARIRSDFRISLPQPRDRKSAEFLVYVDYIYKVMTQPELELGPFTKLPSLRKPSFQVLPHATAGGMAGLLEVLNDRGGKEDLYHLAEELLMEVNDLFPIVDEAVMLGFADSTQGDVRITPAGKEFAEADIATRKKLFREAVLYHVTLIQQIRNALERKSDRAVPLEFFRDVLDEHLSQEDVQRQIDTALNWGRYAEIFTYDSETDMIDCC